MIMSFWVQIDSFLEKVGFTATERIVRDQGEAWIVGFNEYLGNYSVFEAELLGYFERSVSARGTGIRQRFDSFWLPGSDYNYSGWIFWRVQFCFGSKNSSTTRVGLVTLKKKKKRE